MAATPEPSNLDPYKFLKITLNSDGSLSRSNTHASSPATPLLITDSQLTLSKDIPLNADNKTFLRLYRPVVPPTGKIPIILYFHGGGFIICSPTTSFIDLTCSSISAHSPALVVSLEYRLAPEHRLPAAYDDGMEAIKWLCDQASNVNGNCDEWLSEFAEFSKVYLMGSSAGGNLTYHAGLRAVDLDLDPIKIVGLIMDQPFFGGVKRTEAELRLVNDPIIPLAATDLMWSLALPLGSHKDHEYCNPLLDQEESTKERIKRLPSCLIRVNGEDPMVDRHKDFVDMLEARGVLVTRKLYDEGSHGADVFDPKWAQIMHDDVKDFIWS